MTRVLRCAGVAICLVLSGCDSHPETGQDAETPFDIVIQNGRVIDPETGLDAVRSVGVRADRIEAVSSEQLEGKTIIDATGTWLSRPDLSIFMLTANGFLRREFRRSTE